jgi:hypothetical protein
MAVDPCFLAFLRDVVDIWKPTATVNGRGLLEQGAYELRESAVPCALQPLRASLVAALTGQVGRISHVAYLEPTDVVAGDLLVERRVSAVLAADAHAGDRTIRLQADDGNGGWAVIGEGAEAELVLIEGVMGGEAQLSRPLAKAHAAQSFVWFSDCHEVVEVCDEAGAGHHLRLGLKQWGGAP